MNKRLIAVFSMPILALCVMSFGVLANPLPERVKGFKTETREWRAVGPGGGGWIQSMQWSRHSLERFFVGCDVGGFYYSEDAGKHYEMRNRGLENMYVETIAEHPCNPDILLIGTLGGVFKTADRGVTWKPMRSGFPKISESSFTIQVSKLVFHPTKCDTVFLAVGQARELKGGRGEIWRSDDCGETWRMIVKSGLSKNINVFDLVFNVKMPNQILISTDKGIFRSEDGGETWVPSNDGLPAHLRTRHLARSESHPHIVYVTLRQKGGEKEWSAGVCRSEDGGRTWEIRSGGIQRRSGQPGCGDMLCTWTDCIAVDRDNPDVVWTGGASWWYSGILKTTDGGKNWKQVFGKERPGWINFWGPTAKCMSLSPIDGARLAFGTSGQVYATEDGGGTWKQRYSQERDDGKIAGTGLEVTCLHSITPSRHKAGRFYLGYYDIGLLITDDNGKTMTRKSNGLSHNLAGNCFTVAEAPDDENLVWAGFGSWGGGGSGCIAKSCDGGETWMACTNAASNWVEMRSRDLTVLGAKPNYHILYAGSKGIVESLNGGDTWHHSESCVAARVRTLAYSDGKIFAGVVAANKDDRPGIYVRDEFGKEWKRLTPANWFIGVISKVAVEGNHILVTARSWWDGKTKTFFPGGVWLSTDLGKTWKHVVNDKFCGTASILNGELYVGLCDHPYHDRSVGGGVIHSADDGETWSVLDGPGMQNWNPSAIAADPHNPRALWIGTGGNSIFVSD